MIVFVHYLQGRIEKSYNAHFEQPFINYNEKVFRNTLDVEAE